MIFLLVTLLSPTPPALGPDTLLVGEWAVTMKGWTGHMRLEPDGRYWAWTDPAQPVMWVGTWSLNRGTLTIREQYLFRHGDDGPLLGAETRHEFPGLRVTRGTLAADRLTGTRVPDP